jgi:hypothetical protein
MHPAENKKKNNGKISPKTFGGARIILISPML